MDKIEKHVDDITITRKYQMDDADVVLISFGCSVRSSLSAIEILRKKGVKAGLLQLVTVWPMPEKEIRAALQQAKTVIVPELNLASWPGKSGSTTTTAAKCSRPTGPTGSCLPRSRSWMFMRRVKNNEILQGLYAV